MIVSLTSDLLHVGAAVAGVEKKFSSRASAGVLAADRNLVLLEEIAGRGHVLLADRLSCRETVDHARAAEDLCDESPRRGASIDDFLQQTLHGRVAVARVGGAAHRIDRQQVMVDAADA